MSGPFIDADVPDTALIFDAQQYGIHARRKLLEAKLFHYPEKKYNKGVHILRKLKINIPLWVEIFVVLGNNENSTIVKYYR